MNREQAQALLWLYRPGGPEENSPEVREALQLAQTDSELQAWLAEHLRFQAAICTQLRSIPVPAHLKPQVLAKQRIIPLRTWWQQPVWYAAAAVLVIALGLAALWLRPVVPDRFADFRNTMVSRAGRVGYTMDWLTGDMQDLRRRLAERGAPANYELPGGLDKLALTGGAAVTWRTTPVSMLCFDRGDKQMVFLFVMERSALKDPPPQTPVTVKVDALLTVSWSSNGKAYLLAGPEKTELLQRYF